MIELVLKNPNNSYEFRVRRTGLKEKEELVVRIKSSLFETSMVIPHEEFKELQEFLK